VTDPQNPQDPQNSPPPYGAAPPPAYGATPPPAYGATPTPAYGATPAPSYGAAPPAPYGAPSQGTVPGKTMGIVALILAFFVQLVALILGIIALVQSKRAGYKNTPAVWAIIVSSVLMVVGIIIAIAIIGSLVTAAAELCAQYGTGTHEINGVPVTLNCPSN
jgi:hypothetical protein